MNWESSESRYLVRNLGKPKSNLEEIPNEPSHFIKKMSNLYRVWHETRSKRWYDKDFEPIDELEVLEKLNERGLTIILGEPGSGKTTLIKHWARKLSERVLNPSKTLQKDTFLPVYARCGFFRTRFEKNYPATALNVLKFAGLNTPDVLTEENHLKRIFLFDALDELPRAARNEFIASITELKGHVVITCRTAIWENEFESVFNESGIRTEPYVLLGLTPEQQLVFLSKRVLPTGVEAWTLCEKLQSHTQLMDIARNALLLEMIAFFGDPLPVSRAVFYRKAIEAIWDGKLKDQKLEKSHSVLSQTDLNNLRPDRNEFLAKLALNLAKGDRPATQFTDTDMTKIAVSLGWRTEKGELVIDGLKACGLIVVEANDEFSFIHPTFQEYSLAQGLLSYRPDEQLVDGVKRVLREHWNNSDLIETLGLVVATAAENGVLPLDLIFEVMDISSKWDKKEIKNRSKSPLRIALHILNSSGVKLSVHNVGRLFRVLQQRQGRLSWVPWLRRDRLLMMAIASDSQCPTEILDVLSDHSDQQVRLLASRHLTLPPKVSATQQAFRDLDRKLRHTNPNLTFAEELSRRLSVDPKQDSLLQSAENPTSSERDLQKLSENFDTDVRRAVAENSSTPKTVLQALARDPERSVKRAVAGNQNTSLAILKDLTRDQDSKVRQAVARNPSAPESFLANLAEYPDPLVRQAVADNANVTIEVMMKLLSDRKPKVRRAVALNPRTLLEILVGKK